jgi:hypothetical protein
MEMGSLEGLMGGPPSLLLVFLDLKYVLNSSHELIAEERETRARYMKVMTVVYIDVLPPEGEDIPYIRNLRFVCV